MATVVMRFDTSDVQQAMRAYKSRFPKAVRRSLRRAGTSARAQLVRDVAADMKLKAGAVREQVQIREAAASVAITATTRRVPLYDFLPGSGDPRGPYPSRGRRAVRVRGKVYPGAFVARMASGHWGVFKRTQPWRLPIAELRGASVWQSATNNATTAQARGLESLKKNLASELHFAANLERQQ